MDKNTVISVNNVNKTYRLYKHHSDRLKEIFHPFRKKYYCPFNALTDVSFEVKNREAIGIIGKNGSGKSTLLQIISGVAMPSGGSVEVNGKVSALLELGAGFNPEFTGIDNVYINASLLGYSKEEIEEKLDDILAFADIGDFVYQPVKTYSSGMYVRLGFAVAINVEPDILIVDEALSVGDIRFQQKCHRKIDELKEKLSILFVSHDMGTVINLCDRAIWLDQGKIYLEGEAEQVCKEYTSYMSYGVTSEKLRSEGKAPDKDQDKEARSSAEDYDLERLPEGVSCFGEGGAEITGAGLFDSDMRKVLQLKGGEKITLVVRARTHKKLVSPILGFLVKDRLGNSVCGSNTFVLHTARGTIEANGHFIVRFHLTWPRLAKGQYTITLGLAEGTQLSHTQEHWVHDALIVESIANPLLSDVSGLLILDDIVAEMEKVF